MPSINHDGPIEVIRNNPSVTADLVRLLTPVLIPEQDRVRVDLGSADASNVVPDEFRADMVTIIRDRATGDPLLLVVIEPQGRKDKEKRFSWPAYLANLRAAHQCDYAILIVICWDEAEAEKCREAIPMGHPGFILVPVVIGPRDGLNLTGVNPWLTILAGSMNGIDLSAEPGRRAVLDAIRDTHSNTPVTRALSAIILGVAPDDATRSALEGLMVTKEYKTDFWDRMEARAEAEGRARGEAEGRAKGEAEGRARGEAKVLVKILDARAIELTTDQRDLVLGCTDPGQLDVWVDRALAASSADEVFKD
jgi:hypothetical protein